MRLGIIRFAAIVVLALGLSACATPAIDTSSPSHIAAFDVESRPGLDAGYLVDRIRSALPQRAQSYDKGGAAKRMKVVVANVSYVTAGTALLGFTSRVLAEVTVEDIATQKQEASFAMEAEDVDGPVGNIGRIMRAASIDDRKHDDAMATAFAKKAFFKIYAQ